MKRFLIPFSALLSILLTISLVGCGPKVTKGEKESEKEGKKAVILRFGDDEQQVFLEASKAMVERFNQRAGGQYIIELHNTQELVATTEILDAVRTGAVEMCQMPVPVFGSVEPRFGIAEIPFLFNNIDACNYAYERLLPMFNGIYESKFNQKVLTYWNPPALEVASVKKPVIKLEDWKGLLVQSLNPTHSSVIDILGGTPVSIPWHEGYTALQRGVVDATIQSTIFMVDYNLEEVVNHLTSSNFIFGLNMLTINLDIWNAMPKNIQDILLEECQQLGQEKREAFKLAVKENLDVLAARGMNVHILDNEERARWAEVLQPLSEKLIEDSGDFGQSVKKIAEEANSKYTY